MENQETLQSSALVSLKKPKPNNSSRFLFPDHPYHFSDSVQHNINELFAHCIVTTCIIIGRILLASDQLLRMEELPVLSSSDLIYQEKQLLKVSPN